MIQILGMPYHRMIKSAQLKFNTLSVMRQHKFEYQMPLAIMFQLSSVLDYI